MTTGTTSCIQRNGPPVALMCGPRITTTAWDPSETVLGLTTGVDVVGGANRLAVFADASYGTADGWAVGLGLAWRR